MFKHLSLATILLACIIPGCCCDRKKGTHTSSTLCCKKRHQQRVADDNMPEQNLIVTETEVIDNLMEYEEEAEVEIQRKM